MKYFSAPRKGLTLIELLLVITIVGVLFIPLLITYRTARTTRALDTSAEEIKNHATSAHIFAREAREKLNWGLVSSSDSTYAIVKEDALGRQTFQNYTLPSGVKFVSNFEVIFKIGSGETDGEKIISLINSNGLERKIQILSTGIVEVLPP